MSSTANYSSTPQWRDLYEAAVLELDGRRLLTRIEEASQAIVQRLQSMDPANQAEAEPLTNALQVLQDLRKIGAQDGKYEAA